MTLPEGWDSKKSNSSSEKPQETKTITYNPKTVILIIIAVAIALIVAFLIINQVMNAQNVLENAGVKLTTMDRGLLFS
jgi:hypothetical protein